MSATHHADCAIRLGRIVNGRHNGAICGCVTKLSLVGKGKLLLGNLCMPECGF